jgi:hypothetical protein
LIAASLAYSVYLTSANQPVAYFNTFTRLWEFGIGGALAVFATVVRNGRGRAILGWLGLGAIAVSALALNGDSLFPGWLALLPVLGAAAVIASSADSVVWGPHRLLALRPVQWLGDVSYSIYLWHFPIIVLVQQLTGSQLTMVSRLAIIAATLVLAALTKSFVEDPFRRLRHTPTQGDRRPRRLVFGTRPAYGLIAAAVAFVLLASVAGLAVMRAPVAQARGALAAVQAQPPACLGATTLQASSGCPVDGDFAAPSDSVVPSPLIAMDDFVYPTCQQAFAKADVKTCHFGSTAPGAPKVALVGDSHARQWLPALIELADAQGWSVTTYLKSGCAFQAASSNEACANWNAGVLRDLTTVHYGQVLTSARSLYGPAANPADLDQTVASIRRQWSQLNISGTKVIAIRDIPQPAHTSTGDIPQCVFRAANTASCAFDQADAEAYDVIGPAAAASPQVLLVNLNRYFCDAGRCGAAIGGALVYLDDNHMTATFSRTLAGPLAQALARAGVGTGEA